MDELKGIALANEDFLKRQAQIEEDLYQASLTQSSENQGPLQILFASCSGQKVGAINWNPYTQTSTLAEWLTKFGALLTDEIPRRLPQVYNSTYNGCIDGPNFCVVVNITEVKEPFDDILDEDCVNKCGDPIRRLICDSNGKRDISAKAEKVKRYLWHIMFLVYCYLHHDGRLCRCH